MIYKLSFTKKQYDLLRDHLFPGDGKEAVAFAICGRRDGNSITRLLVQGIVCIPYEKCHIRTEKQVKWSTDSLPPLLDRAAMKGLSIVKIHSHPNGLKEFSAMDDASDRDIFSSFYSWIDSNKIPHASVIMLPEGTIFGRVVHPDSRFTTLQSISVIGEDLLFWHNKETCNADIPDFADSHAQAFGEDTFRRLKNLRVAVVGCSGTGSPTIEQLARLGVGELILVDPDIVEERNINRILNSNMDDAQNKISKVQVMTRAVESMGIGTKVLPFHMDIDDPEAIYAVAECDVVFGCMDGVVGRNILNRLSTFYLLPYFDVGVKLIADGKGGIDQISGSVHYFQPGKSSFFTRKVFTPERLRDETLRREDPAHYEEMLNRKYIEGVKEDRYAVISINMLYSAMAINEFLARIHPYRTEPNSEFSSYSICLSASFFINRPEGEPCATLTKNVGRGDMTPLLGRV